MKKMKKFYIFFFLIFVLTGCISHQEKNFLLNKTNENELSYQFKTYGIKSLNIEYVKYINNEIIDIIPLGKIVYNKLTKDYGSIEFYYTSSEYNKKVVQLRINSQYFKNVSDTKMLEMDVDLSSYYVNVLLSGLQVNGSKENIQLIEFVHMNNPESKYFIELDINF